MRAVAVGGDHELWAQLFNGFLTLGYRHHFCRDGGLDSVSSSWAPLAVMYQSRLLGYLTVFGFFGVVGFSVACYGLCYVVGFRNHEVTIPRSSLSRSEMIVRLFSAVNGFLIYCRAGAGA